MNMWCHLPTGFRRRRILLIAVLLTIVVAFSTTLLLSRAANAVTSTDRTVAFQGRLLTAAGAVVPDGHYNMEFKIYNGGSGSAADNPDGSLSWSEAYINNGATGGVQVKSGFFSVNLGSKTTFGSTVDWDASTLWLSMNIAGTAIDCTAFGSGTCASDGEMLPMKRIAATPYAINAGHLGGISADGFLKAGTTEAQAASFNITGTGTADILQGNESVLTPLIDGSVGGSTLSIGTTNATSITVGSAGATTTIQGNVVGMQSFALQGTHTTANSYRMNVSGTLSSSTTSSQYGIQNQVSFKPTGASLNNLYGSTSVATISGSAIDIGNAYGSYHQLNTQAGYTGQVINGYGLRVDAPSLQGPGGSDGRKIRTYTGVYVDGTSNGGNTSNTINNYGVRIIGHTATAGAGGTVRNYGLTLAMSSGGTNSSTQNYGLHISGNGGSGASNYAIYNSSTASNYLQGNVTIGTTDNPTDSALKVAGNATVTSKVNNLSAFQVQNSASASVLNVSTSSGNILTLGSGNGGVGHVASAASGANHTTTNETTQTDTLDRNIPIGHTLIGSLSTEYVGAAPTLTVTDSKGNSYTTDTSVTETGGVNQFIFSARITTALSKGDTITFTQSNSTRRWAWNVEQFDNIVAVNRLDKTATNSANFGNVMSSGTTAPTSDANELVFGGHSYTSGAPRVLSFDNSFEHSEQQATNSGSADRANTVQWKYVKATGTQNSTITNNIALTWAASVATYRTTGPTAIAGSLGFSSGNGFTGSITTEHLTANRSYALPDESGTICLQRSTGCGFIVNQSTTDQAMSFRIGGTGAIAIDNSEAFRVQTASGSQLFTVDTANNKVMIGAGTTNGTQLVLGAKITAGDPASGTNGAMYYNSNAGKFRCYQAGGWIDCITPLPVSAFKTTDFGMTTTTPTDVSNLSFTLAANTKYYYKFVIMHQSAATTTGIGFGVTTPTSPKQTNWCVNTTGTKTSATAGSWGSYCGTGDATHTTSGVESADTTYTSTMEGYVETDETGTLQLRTKSEVNAPITIKSGSFGILQVVQ